MSILQENISKIEKAHSKMILRSSEGEELYEFYYLGKKLKIAEKIDENLEYITAKVEDNSLIVELQEPLDLDTKELIREHIYKTHSPVLFLDRVTHFSKKMKLNPTNVTFRKAKTRWGSCSNRNSISLNIALTALPRTLSDYVIIHELAHIKHKNHSKAFWNLVAKYYPDYKEAKAELKKFATIL